MRSVTLTDVAKLENFTPKFDICNTTALPYVAFVCCYTDSWMAYLHIEPVKWLFQRWPSNNVLSSLTSF